MGSGKLGTVSDPCSMTFCKKAEVCGAPWFKKKEAAMERKKRLSRPFYEISGLTCLASGKLAVGQLAVYEVDRVAQGIG